MILLFYDKYYFNDKKSKKPPSGDQTGSSSKYFCWFDSPCQRDLRSFKSLGTAVVGNWIDQKKLLYNLKCFRNIPLD